MLRKLLVPAGLSLSLLSAPNASANLVFHGPPIKLPLPPQCTVSYKANDGSTICQNNDAAGNLSKVEGVDATGLRRTLVFQYFNDGGEHLIEGEYQENGTTVVTMRHLRSPTGGREVNDIAFVGGWTAHYEMTTTSASSWAVDETGQRYFEITGAVDWSKSDDTAFPPHYFDYFRAYAAPALARAEYFGPAFDGYVPYNETACSVLSSIAGGLLCLGTGFTSPRLAIGCVSVTTGALTAFCNSVDDWTQKRTGGAGGGTGPVTPPGGTPSGSGPVPPRGSACTAEYQSCP
jgi:hypothetical protein